MIKGVVRKDYDQFAPPAPAPVRLQVITDAAHGNIDAVRELLKNGHDVNSSRRDGKTALILATINGHVKMVEFLIDNGANLETQGGLALLHAVDRGHIDIVKLLIARKVNVDYQNSLGLTSLMMNTPDRTYINLYKYLQPMINWIIFGSRDRSSVDKIAIAKILIEAGANVNLQDIKGNSALMWAAFNGQLSYAQILVENGADVRQRNLNMDTATKIAQRFGCKNIVQFLKDVGGPEENHILCQSLKKNGDVCTNKAKYNKNGVYVCGVHQFTKTE